jgi:hypothetical protein
MLVLELCSAKFYSVKDYNCSRTHNFTSSYSYIHCVGMVTNNKTLYVCDFQTMDTSLQQHAVK